MIIGILYEGEYDEPAIEIAKKIITTLKPGTSASSLKFVPFSQGGSIENAFKKKADLFFGSADCDLGIFISDTDNKEKKVKRIRSAVSQYIRFNYPSAKFIIGFPHTEFEQWFFSEEEAVRKIFDLGSGEIPFADLQPKERFKSLIKNRIFDIAMSTKDIYQKTAELLNLSKLKKCDHSFKRFFHSFDKQL